MEETSWSPDHAVGKGGMPAKQLARFLNTYAEPEAKWREKPDALQTRACRLTLSRWTALDLERPQEVSIDSDDSDHTLSISLRRTDGHLIMNGRTVWTGRAAPDTFLLTGPRQSRWEAVFRDKYDILRAYIPQPLIAECHTEMFGRAPTGMIQLFRSDLVSDSPMRQIARAMMLLEDRDDIFDLAFLESLGMAFVSRLLRVYCPHGTIIRLPRAQALASWRLNLVMEFIDSNLAYPVGLAELSSLVGLSKMHFSTQFKLATGLPPYAYILRHRIMRAQQLLAESDRSAVAIAIEMGFASQAHFTTAFKKIVGETPIRWRQARGRFSVGQVERE